MRSIFAKSIYVHWREDGAADVRPRRMIPQHRDEKGTKSDPKRKNMRFRPGPAKPVGR